MTLSTADTPGRRSGTRSIEPPCRRNSEPHLSNGSTVIAGIMWIGHLWFFNFVNAQVAKTYDADSKKKVIPELMPRALYWFRWGAVLTPRITGFFLWASLVYMGEGAGIFKSTESSIEGYGY